MFTRIKRFFTAFRALRRKAQEERAIRKELNLNSMGYLVDSLVPKPRGTAEMDTLRMNITCKSIMSNEEADQIVNESRIE